MIYDKVIYIDFGENNIYGHSLIYFEETWMRHFHPNDHRRIIGVRLRVTPNAAFSGFKLYKNGE